MDTCLHCKNAVQTNDNFCWKCGNKLPNNQLEKNIVKLFNHGYSYKTILKFLKDDHGITISERTLYNYLRILGLKRKKYDVTDHVVERMTSVLSEELKGPNSLLGYRLMWNRLKCVHGIYVPRAVVMEALQGLDPEGVSARKAHRLERRLYRSLGPNYCWHLDGYDKLKPYGFPIHGCIDGYSRKILWLKFLPSNNNPLIIAYCFVSCINKLGLVPRQLRSDCGSENVDVCAMQCFLRRNHNDSHSGLNAHLYGSSHANQRQEAWWSFYRRVNSSWIINFFKDMVANNEYSSENELQHSCAQYVFGPLIQKNLNEIKSLWNHHYIRKSDRAVVNGRPNELFRFPCETQGHSNHGFNFDEVDMLEVNEYLESNSEDLPDDIPYQEYWEYLSNELSIEYSENWETAKNNYLQLLSYARDPDF